MDDASPYRSVAAPELTIAWQTEAEALSGMRALVELLRDAGVKTDDLVLAVSLRPRVLAFVEADGDTAIYVAWEIAREVNRLLAEASSDVRLHRVGERSPRFVLLTPAAAAARRASGEILMTEPRPIGPFLPVLVPLAGALVALATVVGALVYVGDYGALAITALALVIAGALTTVGARRDPPWRGVRFLLDIPFVVPLIALLLRGELVLLGAVIAALAIAALAQRWRA